MSEKKVPQSMSPQIRLIPIAALLLLGMIMLTMRAVDLHVLQADRMKQHAYHQHFHQYSVFAPRGSIYDRQQRILSKSIEVASFGVIAKDVPKQDIPDLAHALSLPVSKLRKRLARRQGFTWLARQVSPSIAKRVEALHIKGVRREREWQRYYPQGPDMGHLLGFVGIDGRGLEGLEYSFNEQLHGEDGVRLIQRDAKGTTLPGGGWVTPPKTGKSLVLTLDSNIQSIAYAALVEGIQKQRATSGSVVVVDPNNGDILAMTSWPSFNPNNFSHYRPQQWRNRSITDVFEPGSTMKPFTMATALDSGKWNVQSRVFCEHGNFRVANYTIHDDHSEGWLDMTGVIQHSSNIGTAKIALDIGAPALAQSLMDLGFGQHPHIGLAGSSAGLLADVSKWGEVETANIAFGQGIAVTTLQLASAFSTLAHDGQRVFPRLLLTDPVHLGKQVFSIQNTQAVNRMLVAATSRQGTGFRAVPKGYEVAGKTGTAQQADGRGRYDKEKYTAVFAGFVPASAPALVIVVEINEPKKSIYGGVVAAPIFRAIASASLPYLSVIPSIRQQAHEVMTQHKKKTVSQPKKPASNLDKDASVSFLGLSLRESYKLAHQHGWTLHTHGSGWVVKQKPSPHEYSNAKGKVEVWLHE
ncbi:MAG: penicillin-binding transpeptidase domain-containing protein [Mariprofundaceae bacterium]|nr:penicillin-binding transpeptidase domain-containing protein [Mariprofundaceae bacterium]